MDKKAVLIKSANLMNKENSLFALLTIPLLLFLSFSLIWFKFRFQYFYSLLDNFSNTSKLEFEIINELRNEIVNLLGWSFPFIILLILIFLLLFDCYLHKIKSIHLNKPIRYFSLLKNAFTHLHRHIIFFILLIIFNLSILYLNNFIWKIIDINLICIIWSLALLVLLIISNLYAVQNRIINHNSFLASIGNSIKQCGFYKSESLFLILIIVLNKILILLLTSFIAGIYLYVNFYVGLVLSIPVIILSLVLINFTLIIWNLVYFNIHKISQ